VTQKNLYLQPSGAVSFSSPSVKESFDEYVSDPLKPVPYTGDVHTHRTAEYMTDDQRFAARRPDVMVYQTDILTEDITLTGPLSADLFVSTTGTDADFVVKLIDVFPTDTKAPEGSDIKVPLGGYQMLVRGEIFRGKYRNSFEKPEPFVPGKVTEVKYELPDIAHTFKKGHRIMVQVQNSWFPLADRNPQKFVDIYKCSDSDFQKATQRIYHDSKYPTSLRVNVLQQ
jgi:putative CocE/NonD family hydrolase